jgi:threonine dehydrogenase-like Zn-dependent dehydrogenase
VYASDISPYRLNLAKRLGAMTIDAGAGDTVDQLRRLEPDGCEVVIEAAGSPDTQRQAIAMAAPGGQVMIVAHSRGTLELRTSGDLIQREVALVGSEYFPIGEFRATHALVADGRLDPRPILTHSYPLQELKEACDMFFSGATGKVVIHP